MSARDTDELARNHTEISRNEIEVDGNEHALARIPRGDSLARDAWRRLRRDRAAWCALWFLAFVVTTSLLAPLLPLPSPVALQLRDEPLPPTPPWVAFGEHGFVPEYWQLSRIDAALVDVRRSLFGDWQTTAWLGTDGKGRDLLSRIVWGSRTSLAVGLLAALCSLVIGVTWGSIAGLVGGRLDNFLMRIVDVLYSLPFVFLVIFLIALLGEYQAMLEATLGLDRERLFYVAIGAVFWLTMARVVRGQVLGLRNSEFVQASRAMGASLPRLFVTHVLPNITSVVIVYLTLSIPSVMLFEAFLSFLGLGLQPPQVSWGLLAVDGAESITPLRIDWWIVLAPAAAMGSVLLALNVLGDGVRDALDPKLARNE